MNNFVYKGLPARVLFGSGTIEQVRNELEALGVSKALVLSTPPQADSAAKIAARLGDRAAGVFSEAAMHTPMDVTAKALDHFNALEADGVVSFGGGSTIGLGKAIALRNDTPQLAIPTTYAGSEMTAIIGQTENGLKTTQTTLDVLPETVIYDTDFTMTLPVGMSVTSGMNAIAHAVEAMYAAQANPVLSLMAEEGISALVNALLAIIESPSDKTARHNAAYGAWLCAMCLGSGGVALHHKLCHVLGGTFNLPHAETHTIVLPHALAYNERYVEDAMKRLRRATASDNPASAFFDIAHKSGVPTSLKELGMPESGIDEAVQVAFKNPYFNPRPLEKESIHALIKAAWAGERPG